MTKNEMRRNLDIIMLRCMNNALYCAEEGYIIQKQHFIATATGIALSASILGLLTDEDFDSINHALSFTSLRWQLDSDRSKLLK